jgi:hypothetical protein
MRGQRMRDNLNAEGYNAHAHTYTQGEREREREIVELVVES